MFRSSAGGAHPVRAGAILVATAIALMAASGPPATAAQTTVQYRQVDLGTLGGESSFATAMNDRGAVVGRAQTADGTYHGFLWRNGSMTDLGLFSPRDVNNRGQVIGTSDDTGGAFLWARGTMRRLNGITSPTALNDRGQVVGGRSVDYGSDVPVLWSKGRVRTLPLDTVSDINNRGQVAGGRVLASGGFHASVWFCGKVTDLGAAAFNRSNSYAINDKGWVIGWTFSAEQFERGALWRHGTRTDLGTLGGNLTQAVAINDRGVVLVRSQVPDGNVHPALWRRGVLTDLSTAGLAADGEVADINDRGEIAGSIRPVFGTAHAVVYRPVGGRD